jgi:hypothetical protein
MKPRTTVYVAMNGLVKTRDGINYRRERVTLASDPCVAKYPNAWHELGTVDDDGAAYIVMLGDAAVLPRVVERISPIGRVPVPGAPAGGGLTVETIIRAAIDQREPDGTWPTLAATAEALGKSVERVRQVARPAGGWRGILDAAEEQIADR